MFNSKFEVVFRLVFAQTDEPALDEDDDQPFEDSDDESSLTATIVCSEKLTMPEFVSRLNDNKARVLADLGYPDVDMESSVVRVEDVSDTCVIAMLPVHLSH